jgi:hypothetical protein
MDLTQIKKENNMRESKAKELRKKAGFVKSKVPKITGDYNITLGDGTVVNVKKTEPIDPTKELADARQRYKILKQQYYNSK